MIKWNELVIKVETNGVSYDWIRMETKWNELVFNAKIPIDLIA